MRKIIFLYCFILLIFSCNTEINHNSQNNKPNVLFIMTDDLNCDLGAEEYILEELQQVDEIKNAYVTFGAYDIIAEIHAETQEEFEKTVSMKVRQLSRVVSTMTLNVIKGE